MILAAEVGDMGAMGGMRGMDGNWETPTAAEKDLWTVWLALSRRVCPALIQCNAGFPDVDSQTTHPEPSISLCGKKLRPMFKSRALDETSNDSAFMAQN